MLFVARLAVVMGVAALVLPALDGRRAAAQNVTEFPLPTANSGPSSIAAGSDGALWFTEGSGKIGRITTAGVITEFPLAAGSMPATITAGPDGALWFTEAGSNKIGRITTAGAITEFPINSTSNKPLPFNITVGADGRLWFTEFNQNAIGVISRFDTAATEFPAGGSSASVPTLGITSGPDAAIWFTTNDGVVVKSFIFNQSFNIPTSNTQSLAIARGPDGALWFTEFNSDKVGRVTTAGTITETPLPSGSAPRGIITGPDGALWFTEQMRNEIGQISTGGSFTEFAIPTPNSGSTSLAVGPDGALWFTESGVGRIGRLAPPKSLAHLFSATLPASRSIQISHTATAFATIINNGQAATNCGIVPVTSIPGTFAFQTTDPKTNALTGSPNTRVPIAAGASQSFVVAFTAGKQPSLDFAQVPVNVVLGYTCDAVDAAATIVGVNTLLLTFDANPVPDVITIGLTPSNDGFARTGGPSGIGLFAIATSNIGVAGSLTARVRLSNASLPIAATVCQSNPSTGQCLAPAAPTVTTTINQNQNQTWTAFLQASGAVTPDPASSRAFFEFVDQNGVVRGSTSTAVTTQ
jgi:virginiamycin B lyase